MAGLPVVWSCTMRDREFQAKILASTVRGSSMIVVVSMHARASRRMCATMALLRPTCGKVVPRYDVRERRNYGNVTELIGRM